MDWFDESIGPFFFRSGAWPSHGSKTAPVLPAYRGAGHYAAASFDPTIGSREPDSLEITIGLTVEPPGDFLRVDATEPRVDSTGSGSIDPTRLQWTGASFPEERCERPFTIPASCCISRRLNY
jgi:hypothetical protein